MTDHDKRIEGLLGPLNRRIHDEFPEVVVRRVSRRVVVRRATLFFAASFGLALSLSPTYRLLAEFGKRFGVVAEGLAGSSGAGQMLALSLLGVALLSWIATPKWLSP